MNKLSSVELFACPICGKSASTRRQKPFDERKLQQHMETHLPEVYNPHASKDLKKKLIALFGQSAISKYFNEKRYYRSDESRRKPKELRDIETDIWYNGKDCDVDALKENVNELKQYALKRPDHTEYVSLLISDVQDGIRSLRKNPHVGVILVDPDWAGGDCFSGDFSHLRK